MSDISEEYVTKCLPTKKGIILINGSMNYENGFMIFSRCIMVN